MPNIVIVGAGFVGLSIWKILAPLVDTSTEYCLVLISARPNFYYVPSACRMLITAEGHLDSMAKPLSNRTYNSGRRKLFMASVTAIVEEVEEGEAGGGVGGYIQLDNGEQVDYSVLILAPGSLWDADGPCALPVGRKEALDMVESWLVRFEKAKEVVIIGESAVGLEFAGEMSKAGKNVTVVRGQSTLVKDVYPERWSKVVVSNYGARGPKLALGEYIDDPVIRDGFVTTRAGKLLPADIVLSTRGAHPNTTFLSSLDETVLTLDGTVKVSSNLQLKGHPRIFAGGDIIDWTEHKQAAKSGTSNAAIIAHNVSALLGLKRTILRSTTRMQRC